MRNMINTLNNDSTTTATTTANDTDGNRTSTIQENNYDTKIIVVEETEDKDDNNKYDETARLEEEKDEKVINEQDDTYNNNDDEEQEQVNGIKFVDYVNESQLDYVMSLVGRDLSEPYSIFTYRYFLHRFPNLCILAVPDNGDDTSEPIGCVVGKIDYEEDLDSTIIQQQQEQQQYQDYDQQTQLQQNNNTTTSTIAIGYIGMLAVSTNYRRQGIGKILVSRILHRMISTYNCISVTLETEVTNIPAQKLYQDYFGFIREELLVRYYLNWNNAYRLRLWFDSTTTTTTTNTKQKTILNHDTTTESNTTNLITTDSKQQNIGNESR